MREEDDIATLETAAARLREIDALFDGYDVGVCAIHLDACIASLESRLLKAKSGALPMRRVQREADSPSR